MSVWSPCQIKKAGGSEGAKGSTGAPGDDDTVCKSCHNGPINVEVKIHILDGLDTIQEYEPSKSYSIHVRVNKTGGNDPKAYGFQMTLLNAAEKVNGPNLKEISPISSNVKLITLRTGRLYAEHVDRSEKNLFEIQWTAPVKGSGPVTIYAGGTGVNSNGSDSGDGGNKVALQVNEKTATGTVQSGFNVAKVFPNPFHDKVHIERNSQEVVVYELFDFLGKRIEAGQFNSKLETLDLSEQKDGIYFLKFLDLHSRVIKTQKLIKRNTRT
ncbi:MAG: T9SS type A sorting domain-containing protein [Saprospiraceae bacterium]|nr:T9SS type A sorting domain-containing protein [Saprospiraceae bacterium]